jgi:hypothetical protein
MLRRPMIRVVDQTGLGGDERMWGGMGCWASLARGTCPALAVHTAHTNHWNHTGWTDRA